MYQCLKSKTTYNAVHPSYSHPIEESANQEHGDMHSTSLQSGGDDADDTDDLDRHPSAESISQEGKRPATNGASCLEDAICGTGNSRSRLTFFYDVEVIEEAGSEIPTSMGV